MRLPKLPNQIRHYKRDVLQFGGLNVTATARDGEYADCSGFSVRDYPYLRQELIHREIGADPVEAEETGHYDAPQWARWYGGALYVIDGGTLKKNGNSIGAIGTVGGNLSVAIVNTKMVFWQLGKYLDLTDDTLHEIQKKYFSALSGYTISGDTVTYPAGSSTVFDSFEAGDVVDIYGTDTDGKVAEGKRLVIESVASGSIIFSVGAVTHREPVTGEVYNELTIAWSIPDLDFVCSSGNRLWGCSTSEQTVFVSALGDPQVFFDYTTFSGDSGSYAFAVSSDGPFTGICPYSGYVCVWKEDILYKIMGSYPSEYYTVENVFPGVAAGSPNSLVNINEILYYLGKNGRVYLYGGNRPSAISQKIGEGFRYGVGFTDGKNYWIDMESEIGRRLYVYDVMRQMWVCHDLCYQEHGVPNGTSYGETEPYLYSIVMADERLYVLTIYHGATETSKLIAIPEPGDLYGSVVIDGMWYAEMTDIVEDTFARKGYTRLIFRLDMATGAEIRIYAKEDRRQYRLVWEKTGSDEPVTMLVPIRLGRCDRYQIRIEGTGEVTIRGIEREYVTGSEK